MASRKSRASSMTPETSRGARAKATVASRDKVAAKAGVAKIWTSKPRASQIKRTPEEARAIKNERDKLRRSRQRALLRAQLAKNHELSEDEDGGNAGRSSSKSIPNNGRFKGRKLIRWSPFHDQALLLCIQYECYEHKIDLPWQKIADRLAGERNSTDMSIIQHINKLRGMMLDQGRFVTPLMGRKDQTSNDNARGVIKVGVDQEGRPVYRDVAWGEDLSLLFNPKDIKSFVPRGKYKLQSPATLKRSHTQANALDRATGVFTDPATRRKNRALRGAAEASEVDPADLSPDGDYDPNETFKRMTRAKSKGLPRNSPSYVTGALDDEHAEESETETEVDYDCEAESEVGDHPKIMLFNDHERIEADSNIIVLKPGKAALKRIADLELGATLVVDDPDLSDVQDVGGSNTGSFEGYRQQLGHVLDGSDDAVIETNQEFEDEAANLGEHTKLKAQNFDWSRFNVAAGVPFKRTASTVGRREALFENGPRSFNLDTEMCGIDFVFDENGNKIYNPLFFGYSRQPQNLNIGPVGGPLGNFIVDPDTMHNQDGYGGFSAFPCSATRVLQPQSFDFNNVLARDIGQIAFNNVPSCTASTSIPNASGMIAATMDGISTGFDGLDRGDLSVHDYTSFDDATDTEPASDGTGIKHASNALWLLNTPMIPKVDENDFEFFDDSNTSGN
ncbi:MAG: hypothetical protein M1818_002375 [Claussenomyces sp. TS43310]|nr:MAG: hypothetical protein M1818_002375 [Claussenomyces sp. TS43310]